MVFMPRWGASIFRGLHVDPMDGADHLEHALPIAACRGSIVSKYSS
jgi:hypothetical protein